jgi:hypothetical protein
MLQLWNAAQIQLQEKNLCKKIKYVLKFKIFILFSFGISEIIKSPVDGWFKLLTQVPVTENTKNLYRDSSTRL